MLLRNTREPFDEVGPFDPESEVGANWIEYYERHGYEEARGRGGSASSGLSPIGDGGLAKRGKKAEEPEPPADLGQLADDISKTGVDK